ncbi:MAG: hypothetical protein JXB17_11710, partial [Bacteroidales bacterium]|nr:hypothetical protein [Bacteroidales bacterium]
TSHGSYSSGEKIVNKTIVFTGAGSIDNDSQDGGYTPKWEWAVSVDNSIWQTMGTTTSILYNYVFTTADTFFIRVRFCDNDNQWGSYYTFTIEIIDCKRYYYVKDHLGNIRQTIDENGVIISAQDYSPYGEIVRSYNNADVNDKYKFTEKERDKETNLDYFGVRYYDASIGRWLAVDPLKEKFPSWTPYNYVKANPLTRIDPNGMEDGNYYDEQGNYIGTDNINDNKTYIVSSNNKTTVANALTSGNTSAAQQNSLLIPQHASRQDMYKIASKSLDGKTDDEYCGAVYSGKNGNEEVIEGTPSGVTSGLTTSEATLALNPSDPKFGNIGLNSQLLATFHAHPNRINSATGTYAWNQPPSTNPGDIANGFQHGNLPMNNYVYTDQNVYIYNGNGVLATVPTAIFNSVK